MRSEKVRSVIKTRRTIGVRGRRPLWSAFLRYFCVIRSGKFCSDVPFCVFEGDGVFACFFREKGWFCDVILPRGMRRRRNGRREP